MSFRLVCKMAFLNRVKLMRRACRQPICLSCRSNSASNRSQAPVVILLPWLGASKGGLNKYRQFYAKFGYDVVVKKAEMKDFLWPKTGQISSYNFMEKISNNFSQRKILIHSFSIGCYFFSLMTLHINNDATFQKIQDNVIGQIIDSPVIGSLNEMAFGVSKMTTNNKLVQAFLRQSCMAYFAATKPFTVKLYNECIDEITSRPLKVPSLFLSDLTDPMLQEKALKDLISNYESLGLKTTTKIWESSMHAHHLKMHEKEYTETVAEFLNSLKQQ